MDGDRCGMVPYHTISQVVLDWYLRPRVSEPVQARPGVAQSSVTRFLLVVTQSVNWTDDASQLDAFTARH